MGAQEEAVVKAQLPGKARQHLHCHLPALAFESQHGGLEAGQLLLAGPQALHVRARDLVGLLLVGRSRRRPHLGAAFPADVERLLQRVLGLDGIGQREEALGHGKRVVHVVQRDAVVHDLEEADIDGGVPELLGNLALARGEVGKIDAADFAAAAFRAQRAHARFLLQLGQVVGGGGHAVLQKMEVKQKSSRSRLQPAGRARANRHFLKPGHTGFRSNFRLARPHGPHSERFYSWQQPSKNGACLACKVHGADRRSDCLRFPQRRRPPCPH